jgi:hypothetical protein
MGTSPNKVSSFSSNLSGHKNSSHKNKQLKEVTHPLKIIHSVFLNKSTNNDLIKNISFFNTQSQAHLENSSSFNKSSPSNIFRSMGILKINKMHMLQVLMDIPSISVKSYFGCVSSFKFRQFLSVPEHCLKVSPDFVRDASEKIKYSDQCISNLPEKLKNSESFKLTKDFNTKDHLAFDEKFKMTQNAIKDFGIDIFLYENFFDKVIEMKAVSKTKHYHKDQDEDDNDNQNPKSGKKYKYNQTENSQKRENNGRNFTKQKEPEKDQNYNQFSQRFRKNFSNLVPQNSLEIKDFGHNELRFKKVIKSFQIKPQETLDASSGFFKEQNMHKISKNKNVQNKHEKEFEISKELENLNESKLISHKKCFSNIRENILDNDITQEHMKDNSENNSKIRIIVKSPKGSKSNNDVTIRCSYIDLKPMTKENVPKESSDIFIKFPEGLDPFEKSQINYSHLEKQPSLMHTFYLYSFKDDMTLGNLTNGEKDEYEIVKFHSRSLEDLSKFDWSGSGGTYNQSDFGKVFNFVFYFFK